MKNARESEKQNAQNSDHVAWEGVHRVIDAYWQKHGERPTFTLPDHPRPYRPGKKATLHTMMMAAANGEYDGDRPVVESFNEHMEEASGETDMFNIVLEWIENQDRKISHADIFEHILDVHKGNVGYSIRDTMLFFHALTRDRKLLNKADSGDDSELKHREKIIFDHLEPIDARFPLPEGYSKWPSKNLRNRVGEYYHQYWIMYLSMYYPKRVVQVLTSGEYAIFGMLQGNIKRQQDFNLLRHIPVLRLTLAGVVNGFTVVPFEFGSQSA